MADDGPHSLFKKLGTQVPHRPATRAWCDPLLLDLLGGDVTLFVLMCCCLVSRFPVCGSGKKITTWEIYVQGRLYYNVPTGDTFPSGVCGDPSHIEQQQRDVDGGLRTAGSHKHNQPLHSSPNGCVSHACHFNGRVVMLCSVHITWYMSGLCGHGSLGPQNQTSIPGKYVPDTK